MQVRSVGALVIGTVTSAEASPDDARALHAEVDRFIADKKPMLLLLDVRAVSRVAQETRHALSEHRRIHKQLVDQIELGVFLVTDSALVRGAVAAIAWMSGAFRGHRSFRTRAEASAAAREVLREQRVDDEATRAALLAFEREG